MFKIVGKIDDFVEEIEYEYVDGKGKLKGDKAIMQLVEWEFEFKNMVGPVGQYMEADIDNPLSVLSAIIKCFDSIISYEGDLPEAAEIPEGCIC